MRRWIGWALGGALVAVLAFAPFRDREGRRTVAGNSSPSTTATVIEPTTAPDRPDDAGVPSTTTRGQTGGAAPTTRAAADPDPTTTAGQGAVPEVPDLPEPTERQLAVLGPLIAAMDTGQRAGTPLVLGLATSIIATGLPSESDLPPEARPVLAAVANLLTTPGTRVNELTAQNSVYLAHLDRALGELAFANPALNEVIHQTAGQLATLGRAAAPVSPPGSVFLSDLAVLLTFLVVE